MKFYCPCGQKLSINDDLLGKHVRCPRCQRVLTPPQPLLGHTEIHEPEEDNSETKKVPPAPKP